MASTANLHTAAFSDLPPRTLYALLRLRVDVFVVEQCCPYPELDGRDTEPTTRHMWLAHAGAPIAYLRLLAEPDQAARIGRVVVARAWRGQGHAGRLMHAALDRVGDTECRLDAQSHLAGFYQRYGFAVAGAEFDEDGIAHVPMRRRTVTAAR